MNMKDVWLAFSKHAASQKQAEPEPTQLPELLQDINRQLPIPANER
ncbi:MAG: hypothetical protein LBJ18_00255 [Rickettsiales bacterium]|jgi:hypothetical protein|nr:hypothetical protein [Rickettsiales bacterium]